jgi:DNA-binding PadR family transcriptional regulator
VNFLAYNYLLDIYLAAMKMNGGTTPNALLGLLSLGPMSGYDIRQLIPQSIGHFWSESYGQIYPGLKRLAAEGLVEKKISRQKGKPDRHLYSLTDTGKKQLQEWLKLPVEREVPRSELLLKLFFGGHVSPAVSREHVMAYMQVHQEALKVYGAMTKALKRDRGADPRLPYWLMTLSFGRHRSAAFVKWCRETLKELDRLDGNKKGGK